MFIILNMRFLWRTTSPELLRDVALVCLADGIVGVSFGATSVGGGLAWWVPVALSLLVFAGAGQIAAVGVVLAGGSPLAAVLAGAVLNTRLFPYGFAVADVVGGRDVAGNSDSADRADTTGAPDIAGREEGTAGVSGTDTATGAGDASSVGAGAAPSDGRRGAHQTGWSLRLLRRLAGPQVITDESVAFALRQPDPARRRSAFWACGVALFAVWNVSVLLGVALGSAMRDTNAFGLDATFPAVMLALALPTLTSRPTRIAAGTGAVIAVALTPVLPAGLPLLAALGGLGTRWSGWGRRRGRGRRPAAWVRSHRGAETAVDSSELSAGGKR
jgi:branched chain amino acid efflux pump